MSTFGKYELKWFLHSSETKQTAVARDPFGDEALLRMVRRDSVSTGWLLTMEHEARRLQHVDQPNFNPPLEAGVEGDWAFIAYRWNLGSPLSKMIQRRDWPASIQRQLQCKSFGEAILKLAESLLLALQAVHEVGLVHRDIRPSHIIISPDGAITLSGFGPLCVAFASDGQGFESREFATYASPELAGSIDHEMTPASDLYSLGIVLYTCLTGRPPFEGHTLCDILFKHLTEELNLANLPHEVPDILLKVVRRLFAKEVRDRYQTAESILSDIRSIQACLETGDANQLVIGRHDRRSELTEPAFVGRRDELANLQGHIGSSKLGEHRTLAVVGRSGMGKSRIILETVRLATREGLTIYQSVASNQATQQPLGPLLAIVEAFAKNLTYDPDLAEAAERDLREYKPEISTAMPALAEVLGWEGDTLSGPEELGQGRVVQAFCLVLAQCATSGPTLLCFDDCQWLDQPSLRVLRTFAQSKPPGVVLLLGMRPEEGISTQVLESIPQAHKLEFGELDEAGIFAIAESMAGRLPLQAKKCVATLSNGSPFMATAAMRGLVESKALVATKHGWKIDQKALNDFQTDTDVASVLIRRIENLENNTVELLSVGAVIGKQFDVDVPIGLLNRQAEEVFDSLETARAQGLIWTKPDGQIAFVHDRIREAALERLDHSERGRLHRKVAEFLVLERPDRYFDIAYHFDAADLPDAAWPHALKAAETARATYALDSAEKQYHIAARALNVDDDRCSIQRIDQHKIEVGLANVSMLLGKYEQAEQWLEKAQSSATCSLAEVRVGLRLGELAFKRGDKEQAMVRFEQALRDSGDLVPNSFASMVLFLARELLVQAAHSLFPQWFVGRKSQPSESERLTWTLYSRLCQCYWYVRDQYTAFFAHLRELNLAEVYEPTEELAQAYSEHAPAMSLIRWQSRGLKYARRSLAMRRESQNLWGQGQSQNFLSIMLYSCARYEECLNQAQQAISVLERTGDFWEMHMAQYQAAAAMYRMGRLRDASEAAQSLYNSAVQCGDHQSSGNAIDLWARASLGQVPEQIVKHEAAKELQDHQGRCHVFLAQGVQFHFAGEYEKAIECFEQSLLSVKKTGVLNAYITPNYTWLVTSLRALYLTNAPRLKAQRKRLQRRIKAQARQALRAGKKYNNELPHALREYGAVQAMFGSYRRGVAYLRQSIEVAEQLGAEYEVAKTKHMLAELEMRQHADKHIYAQRYEDACESLNEFEEQLGDQSSTTSLSLIDRFENLLEVGRSIGVATNAKAIIEKTLEASRRLLRCERALVVQLCDDNSLAVVASSTDSREYDADIIHKTQLQAGAVIESLERLSRYGVTVEQTGTFLCSPIQVHERSTYFLYVGNTLLTDLFGEDELRIASFIASAASGALERADGFEQLEQLNENLEQRVVERTEAVVQRSKELEETANELRETQVELEKAKTKAEQASESKSNFLACMSHEIRTPMSAVLGFTEILRTRQLETSDQQRYLKQIHSNSQHLLALLNDLLDFSKIEASKLEVECISCNPYELVTDVLQSLASHADEKELTLEVELDGQLPREIQSDPTRLRQIVTNLVGNAIKFTASGSVIVTLRSEPEQELLSIAVQDTGIGISPEQIKKIFQPFQQADASTTRQFGGTGLGLSISKRLAEALGGDICIASEEGQGSTFTITVATGDLTGVALLDENAPESTSSQVRSQYANQVLQGRRILIVDDVEANRELISFLLRDAGAAVEFAEDGQQAVDFMSQDEQVDAILMDMQMPVLDGYGATRSLRALGIEIPIVAMTANSLQGDQDRCMAAGCSSYLTKPINFEALIETLHELVKDRRAVAEDVETADAEKQIEQAPLASFEPANAQTRPEPEPLEEANTLPQDEEDSLDDVMKVLGAQFLADVENRWDELESAIQSEDYESLAKLAHWIKGTGGTFGFETMQQQMEQLEEVIRSNEYEQIETLMEQFTSEFQQQVELT